MKKITLFRMGINCFGSSVKFALWLNTFIIAINCVPISLCDTEEGRQIIFDELNRIEHGILS